MRQKCRSTGVFACFAVLLGMIVAALVWRADWFQRSMRPQKYWENTVAQLELAEADVLNDVRLCLIELDRRKRTRDLDMRELRLSGLRGVEASNMYMEEQKTLFDTLRFFRSEQREISARLNKARNELAIVSQRAVSTNMSRQPVALDIPSSPSSDTNTSTTYHSESMAFTLEPDTQVAAHRALNIAAARQAGYSDQEIAERLAQKTGYKVNEARKAGYSDTEILDYLSAKGRGSLPKKPE